MANEDWYFVSIGKAEKGPYSMRELQGMLDSGKITPDTIAHLESSPRQHFTVESLGLHGQQPTAHQSVQASQSPQTSTSSSPVVVVSKGVSVCAMRRYRDAYPSAAVIEAAGNFTKIIGGIIALIVFCGVAFIGSQNPAGGGLYGMVGGFILAVPVGGTFYMSGVFMVAQGQLLKATLDSAVQTSPFLTNDEKADVMGLR